MIPGLDGAVLLGGASSRMGRDKSRIELEGRPLVQHVVDALAPVCETVYLVGGEAPDGTRGHRIPDPPGPRCALRGLVAALEASAADRVLVLATDLPLVTPEFLRVLGEAPAGRAIVPRDEAGLHPLCARYEREATLEIATRRLAGDRLALHGMLDGLDVHWLEGAELRAADPSGQALTNVNEPADLARIAR